MTLVHWWVHAPESVSGKVPPLLNAVLIPWFVIGLAIALIPELQHMPDVVRLILVSPVAAGILWMALGVFLSLADKLIGLASFIRRRVTGAR